MIRWGIKAEEILIINGGWEAEATSSYEGVEMLLVKQNSFEYTPLIEIVERQLWSDYWFLLHDTCIVGERFNALVRRPPVEMPEKVAMKGTPSMSIGL